MDLTSFTSKKLSEDKIIKKTDDIVIELKNDSYHITFKTKKGLKDYEDSLFFSPTTSIITDSKEKSEEFFQKSLTQGAEGVMMKSLLSPYSSGIRTGAMAKLKETKEDLDVVILAAEHGQGKRAGFFSSFYVGVLNEEALSDDEQFVLVGKVSSGVKELDSEETSLENLKKLLTPYKIKEENNITYFEPKIVIQIRYQEIQKSSTYSSGFALRFPRIIMLREDKPLEEINTIKDLDKLY